MIRFIVSWKNNRPFQIEVDENMTFLELKKKIAEHYNETYTNFNVLNGNDIIDNTANNKTLNKLNLKRLIRIPDNYAPGGGYNENEFANLNKEFIRKDNVCSNNNSNIPDWRTVGMGINLYGICSNDKCRAKGNQVIMNVGSKEYNVITEGFMGICPICKKYFDLDTCSFYKCDYKCEGTYFDRRKGEWVDLPNEIMKTSDRKDFYYDYKKVVEGQDGKVKYKKLILKVINYHFDE